LAAASNAGLSGAAASPAATHERPQLTMIIRWWTGVKASDHGQRRVAEHEINGGRGERSRSESEHRQVGARGSDGA
jgi:hypothetical protein